jgi:hypothetical protein
MLDFYRVTVLPLKRGASLVVQREALIPMDSIFHGAYLQSYNPEIGDT